MPATRRKRPADTAAKAGDPPASTATLGFPVTAFTRLAVNAVEARGGVARLIVFGMPDGGLETVPIGADQPVRSFRDELAHALGQGETRAADILAGAEMVTATALATRLKTSPQTINEKRRRGELLGLKGATRGYRFPLWQFDQADRPFRALRTIADRLGGDEWTLYRFLIQTHAELRGMTGIEALRQGRDADVLAVAESVGRGDFS